MNKTPWVFFVGLALGSGATWLVLQRRDEAPAPTKAAPAGEKAPAGNPLHLSPAERAGAGITLAKPESRALAPEVQAFGRVLDPSSLATAVAEVDAARGALSASEKEWERTQKLFAAQGNMSAQTVEAAQANVARDRAALTSARARMRAAWGPEVADRAEALSTALAQGGALVQLTVPSRETSEPAPKEARVSLAGQSASVAAEMIGPAPTADPQVQGPGFLALIRNAVLPTGAAVRATLPGGDGAIEALVVPRSAIVYHQGSAWLFVLGAADTFERRLVTLGPAAGSGKVAITRGLKPDEEVAITGAEQLLATELQTGGGEEP